MTNGDRHNGYGGRTSQGARSVGKAMELTRQVAANQPAAEVFAAARATNQWDCSCGATNPVSRTSCRYCREARPRT